MSSWLVPFTGPAQRKSEASISVRDAPTARFPGNDSNRWSKFADFGDTMTLRPAFQDGNRRRRLPLNSEFSVAGSYRYDCSSPVRWILSHVGRHKLFAITAVVAMVAHNGLNSMVQWLIGRAFDRLLQDTLDRDALLSITIALIVIVASPQRARSRRILPRQITAQRLERDSREELYQSLPRQEPDLPQQPAGRRLDGARQQRRSPAEP